MNELRRYLLGHFRVPASDVEDVHQDVLIKAYNSWDRGKATPFFKFMMGVVAPCVAMDYFRHRAAMSEITYLYAPEPYTPVTPEQHLLFKEELAKVEAIINTYPPPKRDMVIGVLLEGKEYEEIGGNCPRIRTMISRARAHIRRELCGSVT